MKLAWNAIVRNERAVIERCVESLLPYIDCGIVVDTGSTDGTQQFLMQKFEMANKPLALYQKEFVNFEQARNEALRVARESELDWDYLLLADADMELRVKQDPWIDGEQGLSYDMRQVGGALGYYNRRLVSRKATGNYVGVTHEYLDVASAGKLDGAYFIDHADGANRPDKLQRDVDLLEAALKVETKPGLIERYTFYLAQSYYDLQNFDKAAKLYQIRTQLGGFDEERWYARLRYAQCLNHMGDQRGFLWEMLQAYSMRPHRAEVLHDLAKHFREQGQNHASLLFSEAGMQLPHASKDLLFVNDWIYTQGLREEFSICAYYDERRRRTGGKECNKLALAGSEQARDNLFWYLQPLSAAVPSFRPWKIRFQPEPGWVPMNPSVINHDGKPLILVRTVNYTITPEGHYRIRGSDGSFAGDHPICTRNFMYGPDDVVKEIQLPSNLSETKFPLVRGFEDSRLFEWCDELWTISTVRELNREGWCEQILARINGGETHNWKVILPKELKHEKNWMPWVVGTELRFVYRLGTLIDTFGEVIAQHDVDFDVSHISGGSQVVQASPRSWIALVHEARIIPGRHNRFYQHRFVSFHGDGRVDRISAPFFFHDKQIEFAAGLAHFLDKRQLMVSYGVRDAEAWTATMDVDEVIAFIYRDAL
jgi:glycosyltransferase involved in cell wall biosynthesis